MTKALAFKQILELQRDRAILAYNYEPAVDLLRRFKRSVWSGSYSNPLLYAKGYFGAAGYKHNFDPITSMHHFTHTHQGTILISTRFLDDATL